MRTISLTLAFLFFISCGYSQAEEFEIKHADSLEADKNQILIKGNIIINYKDALINAPEGKVETDGKGQSDKATFFGRGIIKLKDRSLEADKIIVLIKDQKIQAEGNTVSKLKDKNNNLITITADYQELFWSGEGANARGNLITTYQDTMVTSDQVKIIYKNKKPNQAVFTGDSKQANLEQPTYKTSANEIVFDITTHNVEAFGDVKATIWPDQTKFKKEQEPVFVTSEGLIVDQDSGTVLATSEINKVKVNYEETKGESHEALLLKNKDSGKPEKIIFKGNADVSQPDKQISSEEVVFNFKDKKLTSNTKTNIRPKTVIFKKQ